MKKITKFLLLILSYAPIATIAIAAQAKAGELEGESQTQKLKEIARGARFRLVPPNQIFTTKETAKKRYSDLTGLTGEELEVGVAFDLYNLEQAGLIQQNEKFIRAMSASEHQGSF